MTRAEFIKNFIAGAAAIVAAPLVAKLSSPPKRTKGDSEWLQRVINNAKDGDTIVIPAGTYTCDTPIVIRHGMTVMGSPDHKTVFECTMTKEGGAFANIPFVYDEYNRITGFTFDFNG